MRKFVAQYSAGLRVRLNPGLQSEQVGIIKPNGIISFIDEVRNLIEQPCFLVSIFSCIANFLRGPLGLCISIVLAVKIGNQTYYSGYGQRQLSYYLLGMHGG